MARVMSEKQRAALRLGKGRAAGTPNRITREIKAAARDILERPDYVKSLITRLDAGKAPHMETLLHHYAYGIPKQTVAMEGPDGGPIRQIINHYAIAPPAGSA